MQRLLLIALLTSSLAFSAYAGGTLTWPNPPLPPGGNPATTPVPSVDWLDIFQKHIDESHAMPKVDLIFDGDSITAGWMGQGRAEWESNYAKLNAYDFGIPGDRTENLLWRLQNGQVDNLHPKLIVLLIGTNDLGDKPEQVADGIKAVIGEYQKRCPDAVILLQAIFPRGEPATDENRPWIKAVNQLLPPLADGKKVIYLDFADKFLQPDSTLSKDIMPDFLHPGPKGYQIWVNAIKPVIDQFFTPAN